MILNRLFVFFPLLLFIVSKFFYLSLFQIQGFNFTLSDLSILIMLLNTMMINKNKRIIKIRKFYYSILFLSLFILVITSIGSLIQSTSITNGVLMFIKRWLAVIFIPVYIAENLDKRDIKNIIYTLSFLTLIFFLVNFESILLSLNTGRFSEEMNPNVLGMFISILVIFIISYNFKINLVTKGLIILIGISLIFATSSRGALFALLIILLLIIINRLFNFNYLKIVYLSFGTIIITIFSPYLFFIIKSIFPFSVNRIINTLDNNIIYDSSAAARINTHEEIIKLLFNDFFLLIFGSGFGNYNMLLTSYSYGLIIETADNQFFNLWFWTGTIGLFVFMTIFGILLFRIYKFKNNPLRTTMFLITIYMFLAGISQDTFTEPTINSIYILILGLYECYNRDFLKYNASF